MQKLRLAAAFAALAFASSSQAAVLYSNDFSVNADGFTGDGALENALTGGERYLGALGEGATAVLTLATVAGTDVTLNFDLYGILSLDGSTAGIGPDSFKVGVVGGPVLLDKTFSNFAFQTQTFGPAASNPGRTGSDSALYGHLGYAYDPATYAGTGEGRDTTYHLSYTFTATGASTKIQFFGNTLESLGDERFGIDNVVVSGAVPEPATWAMLLMGFGGLGAVLRRSRSLRLTA